MASGKSDTVTLALLNAASVVDGTIIICTLVLAVVNTFRAASRTWNVARTTLLSAYTPVLASTPTTDAGLLLAADTETADPALTP